MVRLPHPSTYKQKIDPAYNARKAAQIIAFFATKEGGRINILKAMKLVYLSDRKSIQESGFPMLEEPRCSMPHGPVNSTTYDFAKGVYTAEISDEEGWSEFLKEVKNYNIATARKFSVSDFDELSVAEVQYLEALWEDFGHMNQYQLKDWTHDKKNVPEWEDPCGGSASIPLSRILGYVGIEDSNEQEEMIDDYAQIDKLFASLN
ncbi:Panacea domain-containing protein [Microvirga sp. W0021]|uniref:Panacea domain-containing protein n=1 Tax=Hohaiivirga grylli TaxID=3133970 RepID=A0ABV0BN87_9HYPH